MILADENRVIFSTTTFDQNSNREEEFYRRTAVTIPAPINAPSTMKRRSNAMTFLNDACTCFFQTDGFTISGAPIKGENLSLPIICFPIL